VDTFRTYLWLSPGPIAVHSMELAEVETKKEGTLEGELREGERKKEQRSFGCCGSTSSSSGGAEKESGQWIVDDDDRRNKHLDFHLN